MADPAKTEDVKEKDAEQVKVEIPIDTERILRKAPKKKAAKKKKAKRNRPTRKKGDNAVRPSISAFPKHSILACLRIPKAMLEKNAGKESSYKAAANYAGLAYNGDMVSKLVPPSNMACLRNLIREW